MLIVYIYQHYQIQPLYEAYLLSTLRLALLHRFPSPPTCDIRLVTAFHSY